MRATDLIRPWGRRLAVTSLAVTLVAAGAAAFAATDSGAAEIDACVRQGSIISQGSIRVVDSPDQCRANETALSWNQQGPQGPAGPAGTQGPQGRQGPPGLPGSGVAVPCPSPTPPAPGVGGSVSAFARFDGIKGDSTKDGHKDEVELRSVSGGIARASGDPCGPSRLRIDNLVLGKNVDSATVPLMQRAATGDLIPKVDVTFDKALGDATPTFLHYELTNVVVAGIQTDWTGGASIPTEAVTLAFSRICWEFIPTSQQGGQNPPIKACSDVNP